ncbi:MAG: Usg family protein [Alphaproteobacteria bacterium]
MGISVSSFEKQLNDFRLTTAEILYHMPDAYNLLQTFVWQKLDKAPDFLALHDFLDYWERNLDGKLHSVRIAQARLIHPGKVRTVDGEFRLH